MFGNHGFALINGKLCGWGLNSFGQLGLGDSTNRNLPTEVPLSFDHGEVVDCTVGNNHSLILRQNGTVWGAGLGNNGELGGAKNRNTFGRLAPAFFGGVAKIKVYSAINIMKKLDGDWYGWGQSSPGVLTLSSQVVSTPVLITNLPNEEIEDIFIGRTNLFILTKTGELYGRGDQRYVGSTETSTKLNFVKVLSNVTDFVLGNNAYIAKSNGEWYGWGLNSFGQLSLGHNTSPVTLPTKLMNNLERPVFISQNSTTFKMKDGTWLGSGSNNVGQLGLGHTNSQIITPTPLPHLQDVVEIFSMFSTTIIKKEGETDYYGWGSNNVGQLALGHVATSIASSTKINSLQNATKIFEMVELELEPEPLTFTQLSIPNPNLSNITFQDSVMTINSEFGVDLGNLKAPTDKIKINPDSTEPLEDQIVSKFNSNFLDFIKQDS